MDQFFAEYAMLIYSAPAFMMLGLHGLIANHYTRYNLILIGPFAAAGAWAALTIFFARRGEGRAAAR